MLYSIYFIEIKWKKFTPELILTIHNLMTNKKPYTEETKISSGVYPIRINKYLAQKGISTRVGADELIKNKKVLINGKFAVLGDKVNKEDKVEVKGAPKKYVYLAYNKPKTIVTTNPQAEEKDILSSIKITPKEKIFPVGRLDKESEGLIILTNDGRVTDRLLNPKFEHEKEYRVEVDRKFSPGFLKNLEEGVMLEGVKTKKAKVKKVSDTVFNIILTEGKNRQIKRMTEKLGFSVRNLKRIRIQNINLEKLPSNSHRELTREETEKFLSSIGLV